MHTLIVHAAHEVWLALPFLINSMEENLIEDMNSGFIELQEADLSLVRTGTKDQSRWLFLARFFLVLLQPPEVEFHLTFVCRLEITNL
jgi:hypothetical protein